MIYILGGFTLSALGSTLLFVAYNVNHLYGETTDIFRSILFGLMLVFGIAATVYGIRKCVKDNKKSEIFMSAAMIVAYVLYIVLTA